MTGFGQHTIGCGVLLGLLSVQVAATTAQIAYDNAGDSAYNTGFTQGSNGGYGWGGGWSFSAAFPGFAGLGDSTTNNGLGVPLGIGDINSPRVVGGRAWALNGDYSASRPFAGPLAMRQTFSADFDNGSIGPDVPHDWMRLSAASGPDGMSFGIEDTSYLLLFSSTEINTPVPISYDGIHVSFTREPGGYLVAITPYGPSNLPVPPFQPFPPGTTAYVTVPFDQPVDSVTFSTTDRGAGLANDNNTLYFNNIQITPEPSGAGLPAVAAWAMLRRRRATSTSSRAREQ